MSRIITHTQEWPFPAISNDRKSGGGNWFEISESAADSMLGDVPPLEMVSGGFFMGEPAAHEKGDPVHCLVYNLDGKHYAREIRVCQRKGAVKQLKEAADFEKECKWEHFDKFDVYARALGLDALKHLVLRVTGESDLAGCHQQDEHLNNIPLRLWDLQHAEVTHLARQCKVPSLKVMKRIETNRAPKDQCAIWWSQSYTVCVLKHVAVYHLAGVPVPPKPATPLKTS